MLPPHLTLRDLLSHTVVKILVLSQQYIRKIKYVLVQFRESFNAAFNKCDFHVFQGYVLPDTHTHPFNGSFSGTTRVSRYQKGKTNLDFTEARDSEWQWHQLGHMQVCTSLQTDNHPSCHPTNSVKALKAMFLPGSEETLSV